MRLLAAFWNDDSGLVLSAELVTIGTLGLLGATVGLSMATTAVNDELAEVAQAIRSLDQSYCVAGYSAPACNVCPGSAGSAPVFGAWTAGSSYTQPDVETSLLELELSRVTDPMQQPEATDEAARKDDRGDPSLVE